MTWKVFLASLLSFIGVVIGLSFFLCIIPGKNQPATRYLDRKGLENQFDKIFAENSLSGAVLVSQETQVLFEKTYGWENPKQKIENSPNTQFNIGSCAKQMTAFLILQLEKEGKLTGSEPVERIIPELSNTPIGTVTFNQLLQMSGGVPNLMKPLPYISVQLSSKLWTTTEILEELKNCSLRFEPGTQYEYSNLSYVLLGIAVEKVTGQSWEQVLQDRIFTPFQMNRTTVSKNQPIKNLAKPYLMTPRLAFLDSPIYFPVPQWNYSTLKGAGGIVSTVRDLHLWQTYLSEFAKQEPELASRYFGGGGPGNYSYGWQITEFQDSPSQLHAGETPGYCALIVRCPSSLSTAILLFNSDFMFLKRSEEYSMEDFQNRIISILETLS